MTPTRTTSTRTSSNMRSAIADPKRSNFYTMLCSLKKKHLGDKKRHSNK